LASSGALLQVSGRAFGQRSVRAGGCPAGLQPVRFGHRGGRYPTTTAVAGGSWGHSAATQGQSMLQAGAAAGTARRPPV